MTNFNVSGGNKHPEEWRELAFKRTTEDNLQLKVIGGLILGGVAFGLVNPFAAAAVGVWTLWSSIKDVNKAERSRRLIRDYNCVAHELNDEQFAVYYRQIQQEGKIEQLGEELRFAADNGMDLCDRAAALLEHRAAALLEHRASELSPLTLIPDSQPLTPNLLPTGNTNFYTPPQSQDYDLLAEMVGKGVRNQLFVGIQGSGKGILVSNALRAVKRYHPGRKIFIIDPKGKEEEAGYWEGIGDYVERAKIIDMEPSEVVAWIKDCFDKYAAVPGECLLFLDEGTAVAASFKATKGAMLWLKNKIAHFVSLGDADGKNFWMAVQNGDTDELGISGGMRSQLSPYILIRPAQMSAYESVINLKLLPKDKKPSSEEIAKIASRSPVERAIFHGVLNEWLPMPKLDNHSGFDRDSRTFAQPRNQSDTLIAKLEATKCGSIQEFIEKDLKVADASKAEQLRTSICQTLKQKGREDLVKKFLCGTGV